MTPVVTDLARAFDAAFAAPVPGAAPPRAQYVVVEAGGVRCAVPIAQVAAVLRCPVITRVPSAGAAVLGVASARGDLLAAVDLGAVLGRSPWSGALPAWVLRSAADRAVGLVVDGVVGLRDVDPADVATAEDPPTPLLPRLLRAPDPVPALDVAALLSILSGARP